MLNHIMKEKNIHNFLNPETFVDYRRYDFSDSVFKGLTIRQKLDLEEIMGSGLEELVTLQQS